jgi:hypothetical protein
MPGGGNITYVKRSPAARGMSMTTASKGGDTVSSTVPRATTRYASSVQTARSRGRGSVRKGRR